MTPSQFATYAGNTARAVSDQTGIDSAVLLAQWANETDWGNVIVGHNLGNIRCGPTSFCQYVTLQDFATACAVTFHNGYYGAVLAAVTPLAQLQAIVVSPWSSGHYGGSLQSFYDAVEPYEMNPDEHLWTFTAADVSKNQLLPAVVQLQSEVKALATPTVTVDLSPVLNAIAGLAASVTAAEADIATIKRLVSKDLAP